MTAAVEPSVDLVRILVREQFPEWAHLEVTEVSSQGWDNRTFRLGSAMSVRLPSGAGYAPQVAREHRWLPFLGRHLQIPIPTPLARGAASQQFPWAWSVYRWLDGTPLEEFATVNLGALAVDGHGCPALGEVAVERGSAEAGLDRRLCSSQVRARC